VEHGDPRRLLRAPDGNLDWFVFEDELDKYIKETQPQADTLLFAGSPIR
jgi:hypothetical protein